MNKSILLLIWLVWSCAPRKEEKIAIHDFTRDDFKINLELNGEIVQLDTFNNTLEYKHHLVRDSLLFVLNVKANPFFIEIYNLNIQEVIHKMARRGEGPNEYFACDLIRRYYADNTFLLYDVVKKSAVLYDIDSVLLYKEAYTPKMSMRLPQCTKDISLLNSDTLIGNNFYHFSNENLKNDVPPFFLLNVHNKDIKQITDVDDRKSGIYFTANVAGGYILVSPLSEYIWLANRYKDEIDIYSDQMDFVRTLRGPDKIQPEYKVNEDNMITFSGGYYRGYFGSPIFSDNAVYLPYIGITKENPDRYQPVEVFKFDWNGNPVAHYQLDRFIYSISIDSQEEYLYGTSNVGFGEEVKLVKYSLK